MKKIVLLIFFIVSLQTAFSQSKNIDTTLQKIAAEKDDDKKIDLILSIFTLTNETNPEQGIRNGQKILTQSIKRKDKISEAMALATLGANYRLIGNTIKGLDYELKAMPIAEQTGNLKLMLWIKNWLAVIYKDRAEYARAITVLVSAEKMATQIKPNVIQGGTLLTLGETYLLMNNLDSALMYLQRAYEFCIRNNYKIYIGNICTDLGEVHGKLGNTSVALGYFDLGIQDALITKKPRHLNWAYAALAQYYYAVKQNDSSVVYAKKAIAVVHNTAYSNLSIRPAKLLSDLYENVNNDSTVRYLKMYLAANDSLFSIKAIQQAQVLNFEDELRQQELVAEKLKETEQRKQNIQYALLGLGIITFIITFLLLSRRHITNTKLIQFLGVVALLLVFEFLNLLLHPFLERITHHSPVLMLLALVCIAALLVPLHHKLEKWATHKLVEKNKAIRLAAAKKTIEELERN